MAKLIIKPIGEKPGRTIELKQGVTRIGRSSNNDLSLPFPEVSDAHCEILVENDFVFVRDLDSSNGTSIDGDVVRESALYSGQTLRIGLIEMVLDTPQINISLPELPKPVIEEAVPETYFLSDGFPACMGHSTRHAIWECPHCTRVYCDECIRKLRRVGGIHLKLCPSCSNPCKLTAWTEMMRKKKKGFFGTIISKITDGIKRKTARMPNHPPPPPMPPTAQL
jgi:hypothetical protein